MKLRWPKFVWFSLMSWEVGCKCRSLVKVWSRCVRGTFGVWHLLNDPIWRSLFMTAPSTSPKKSPVWERFVKHYQLQGWNTIIQVSPKQDLWFLLKTDEKQKLSADVVFVHFWNKVLQLWHNMVPGHFPHKRTLNQQELFLFLFFKRS